MTNSVYTKLSEINSEGRKQFAVLVDPDRINKTELIHLTQLANEHQVDFLFVGGSLIVQDQLDECLNLIKEHSDIPTIIFPGSPQQISSKADALFFLSLISGRNPDMLIGQHVVAAPRLKEAELEVIPTGYMLVDGGKPTTVSYMSGTTPIPADKDDIAMCTALAGEMLGLKAIYMDAGSGARKPISNTMIAAVKQNVNIPIIVGGGIRTAEEAYNSCMAGADVVVVGNAIEKNSDLLGELTKAVHSVQYV